MARWATTAIIAGVNLTGCRVELINAEKFLSAYVGSDVWANDGTVDSQIVNIGHKGKVFGVRIFSSEEADLLSIASTVETAVAGLTTFVVNIVHGIYTVNHYCQRPFGQTKWIVHSKNSEGWVEDITLTLITRGAV